MDTLNAIALAGPILYFLLVALSFYLIFRDIKAHARSPRRPVHWLYGALVVISFVHTFTWILAHFKQSQLHNSRLRSRPSVLLAIPYVHIQGNLGVNLDIKEHSTTGGWRIFAFLQLEHGPFSLFRKASRKRKGLANLWAYMFIAEFVAVSTASALFYLAVSLRTPKPHPIPSKKKDDDINATLPPDQEALAPAMLTIPVLLALFAISTTPSPESPEFITNILIIHLLLFIPVLPSPVWTTKPRFLNIPSSTVFFATTALALVLRLQSTLSTAVMLENVSIMEFLESAIGVLHTSPAMATFGWDTIWTTVAFLVWHIFGDGSTSPNVQMFIPMATSTVALGVSFSAPLALGNVVNEILSKEDIKEDQNLPTS
ncbi:SubName: Full=Uncharacterized protein {ECO:0000313/EMBL:CCA67718.1} [Serendipita indica DSM 11827]|nr:SubName: Full=Uncharacterized protein {ECO:0000313/EMBL:CCA67718.1} [Serendipita indica DSM 11827]